MIIVTFYAAKILLISRSGNTDKVNCNCNRVRIEVLARGGVPNKRTNERTNPSNPGGAGPQEKLDPDHPTCKSQYISVTNIFLDEIFREHLDLVFWIKTGSSYGSELSTISGSATPQTFILCFILSFDGVFKTPSFDGRGGHNGRKWPLRGHIEFTGKWQGFWQCLFYTYSF